MNLKLERRSGGHVWVGQELRQEMLRCSCWPVHLVLGGHSGIIRRIGVLWYGPPNIKLAFLEATLNKHNTLNFSVVWNWWTSEMN